MSMPSNRKTRSDSNCYRRTFLITTGSTVFLPSFLGCSASHEESTLIPAPDIGIERRIRPCGPASQYTPTVQVAFVRRKADYGMRWPGAIYDGQAALKNYRQQIEATAKEIGINLNLRSEPIYSLAEADEWIAQAKETKPDGLLVVLLDRQEHAWPTAAKAADTGIPTVIFAPIGAAFTTNTVHLAGRPRCLIRSTDDFGEVAFAMKMLYAGAKLRETRYIVIEGKERRDSSIKHFGTSLRTIPASDFLEEYQRTPTTPEIHTIAKDYLGRAQRVFGSSPQDVINGVKSYVVARTLMEREQGDAITMDCLGALGQSKVSLPCIAWSRMNDHGIPAACERDKTACITHALVQYLFDRPGFQQDPVPDTATGCLIGSHCSCPTRMNGFTQPPEPFYLSFHHGKRDAVPRTIWRKNQRITVLDAVLSNDDNVPPSLIISAGEVVDNVQVPPAGGCVVAVRVQLDGVTDTLAYPGFHHLFFYGDYKKQLRDYCQLFGLQPKVV